MKIKATTMALLVLILIFGGIGLTSALGWWSTTTSKQPVRYAEGPAAGEYNPADIRGSYTFNDIATLFGIEGETLKQAFNLPDEVDLNNFKSKDLEVIYESSSVEIGNGSVKAFVALYLNLPFTLGEDYLTESAVELIKEHNKELTEEQLKYIDTYKIPRIKVLSTTVNSETADSSSEEKSESEVENLVNGRTTFQEVLDVGITKEQLEEILNAKLPSTNQGVKDYCSQKGISFSDIKDKINSLLQ